MDEIILFHFAMFLTENQCAITHLLHSCCHTLLLLKGTTKPRVQSIATKSRKALSCAKLFSTTVAQACYSFEARRVRETRFRLIAALVKEALGVRLHCSTLCSELYHDKENNNIEECDSHAYKSANVYNQCQGTPNLCLTSSNPADVSSPRATIGPASIVAR